MTNPMLPPFEDVLRGLLREPGNAVKEAAGWDSAGVSRFLNGQQGVPIHKIRAVMQAAGFVVVDRSYYEAIHTLGEVGIHCKCAPHALGQNAGSGNTVAIGGDVGQAVAGDASFAAPVSFGGPTRRQKT